MIPKVVITELKITGNPFSVKSRPADDTIWQHFKTLFRAKSTNEVKNLKRQCTVEWLTRLVRY